MAGPRTVSDKLGIRAGGSILLVSAPPGFSIDPLPPGARIDYAPPADTVLVFAATSAEFLDRVPAAVRSLGARGQLWVGYPANSKTDLTRDTVRDLGASIGLDLVALHSLDDNWSAVRLKRS